MTRRTELVLNLIALAFTVLGAMTLLGFLIGLMRGPEKGFSFALVLVSIAYGFLAVAVGVLMFRRSEAAKPILLLWSISFLIFIASMPEMWVPTALPGYVLGAGLLVWLYRYLSKHLGPSPNPLSPGSGRSRP